MTDVKYSEHVAVPASPRVSVVMPVYNSGRYLHAAIESILTQSFEDLELLVLNDGSTDDSLGIAEQYASRDGRISVITHENRGLVATLNHGLTLTRAEYIARMDGDDVAMPDRFAKQVAYLDAHPDCVAVGGDVMLVDADSVPLCRLEYPHTHAEIVAAQSTCLSASVVAHPAAMIRRGAVAAIDGYRREFVDAEDIDLFLRLGETGQLANLPEVVLHYRQHLQSIGYANRRQQWESARAAAQAAIARRGYRQEDYPLEEEFVAQTQDDMLHKWIWWAIRGGNAGTARKYAWRLVRAKPVSVRSWRAFVCAWRGH